MRIRRQRQRRVATAFNFVGGAIGCFQHIHANANQLGLARMRNGSGGCIRPNARSLAAAASADGSRPDVAVSLWDADAEANWPIVAATFVPMPRAPEDCDRGAAVMKVFDRAYRGGGPVADQPGFVPPPTATRRRVRAASKRDVLGDGDPVYKEPPPWPTSLNCQRAGGSAYIAPVE